MISPRRPKHHHVIGANSRVVRNINRAVILNSIGSAATRVNETLTSGSHTVTFDASRFASGIYMYKITAGSFVSTRKMVRLK